MEFCNEASATLLILHGIVEDRQALVENIKPFFNLFWSGDQRGVAVYMVSSHHREESLVQEGFLELEELGSWRVGHLGPEVSSLVLLQVKTCEHTNTSAAENQQQRFIHREEERLSMRERERKRGQLDVLKKAMKRSRNINIYSSPMFS